MFALPILGKRPAGALAGPSDWTMSIRRFFSASEASPAREAAAPGAVDYPFPEALIERLKLDLGGGSISRNKVGVQIGFESTRLSAFLLARGVPVFAVEPNAARREQGQRLTSSWPEFRLLDGSPDATGLADASADFLVSDRALYWPNQRAMRAEFTRILRPRGVVALVTDNRVYAGGEQQQQFEQLLRTHCPSFREKRETQDIGRAVAELFANGSVFEDAFTGEQRLNLQEFLAQTEAMPICPPADDPARASLDAALRRFFGQWAQRGRLVIPTVCRVAFGRMTS